MTFLNVKFFQRFCRQLRQYLFLGMEWHFGSLLMSFSTFATIEETWTKIKSYFNHRRVSKDILSTYAFANIISVSKNLA